MNRTVVRVTHATVEHLAFAKLPNHTLDGTLCGSGAFYPAADPSDPLPTCPDCMTVLTQLSTAAGVPAPI